MLILSRHLLYCFTNYDQLVPDALIVLSSAEKSSNDIPLRKGFDFIHCVDDIDEIDAVLPHT